MQFSTKRGEHLMLVRYHIGDTDELEVVYNQLGEVYLLSQSIRHEELKGINSIWSRC